MAVKKLILLFVFSLTLSTVKALCAFNASVTISNPTSCVACDGSIIVNSITGGQPPYTPNFGWIGLTKVRYIYSQIYYF